MINDQVVFLRLKVWELFPILFFHFYFNIGTYQQIKEKGDKIMRGGR